LSACARGSRLVLTDYDGEPLHALGDQIAGTPLVMIIGYGSTMAEWDPRLVRRLAEHRRVILVDTRGMGNSTGSVRRMTVGTMADDANARVLLRRIPHAVGMRVPDAGHAFLFQDPTRTGAAFARLLHRAGSG
jgi:pimeloyl-ACP methyl ester carboxylesterase